MKKARTTIDPYAEQIAVYRVGSILSEDAWAVDLGHRAESERLAEQLERTGAIELGHREAIARSLPIAIYPLDPGIE